MDEKFYPFLEKIDGLRNSKKYRNHCKNGPACYAGREQIAIDPDGTVFPCLDLRLPMGNLLQNDLKSILKKRKKLLKPYTLEKISTSVGNATLQNTAIVASEHPCWKMKILLNHLNISAILRTFITKLI